jgi:phosphoglycolate phosphatase
MKTDIQIATEAKMLPITDIAAKLGFTAENTVMVGDSEPDIAVARNAGAECIAVSWGYRSREQLVTAGAVTIIDHPHELLEILK